MALPITGGDQQPIVKYNAKSAKWKVDDTLLNDITMIVDMSNVEVGWMKFGENQPPDFKMIPAALIGRVELPAMPEVRDANGKALYRKGFRTTVKVSDRIAGTGPTVREWASNSLATCKGFNALHDLWLASKESGDPTLVPVVKTNGVTEISGQHGVNYSPTLVITKWVKRPSDLKLRLDNGSTQVEEEHIPLDDVPGEPEMRGDDQPEDFSDLE
jgi:hypothetical protein